MEPGIKISTGDEFPFYSCTKITLNGWVTEHMGFMLCSYQSVMSPKASATWAHGAEWDCFGACNIISVVGEMPNHGSIGVITAV